MSTTVRSQSELDAAIAAGETDIIVRSPAGVWLELSGNHGREVVSP